MALASWMDIYIKEKGDIYTPHMHFGGRWLISVDIVYQNHVTV